MVIYFYKIKRFSNDIAVLDATLPGIYFELFELGFKFLIYVIFVAIKNYYIIISGIGACFLFLIVFRFCVRSIKDTAMLEFLTVGPVNSVF